MWQFASLGPFWWRYFNYVSVFLLTYQSFTYQVKVTRGYGMCFLREWHSVDRWQILVLSYHLNQIEYGMRYVKGIIYLNTYADFIFLRCDICLDLSLICRILQMTAIFTVILVLTPARSMNVYSRLPVLSQYKIKVSLTTKENSTEFLLLNVVAVLFLSLLCAPRVSARMYSRWVRDNASCMLNT
jgi:hypothetical protein